MNVFNQGIKDSF